MRRILFANVTYCLTGSDSEYRKLLNLGESEPSDVLEQFKGKYETFFVEDYRWTRKNWDYLQELDFSDWYHEMECYGLFTGMGFCTVPEFETLAGIKTDDKIKDLVPKIFDTVMQYWIDPVFSREDIKIDPDPMRLERGFRRYMMGQLYLTYRTNWIPGSKVYRGKIVSILYSCMWNRKGIGYDRVEKIRSLYAQYIDTLTDLNVITEDDGLIYREVYPIVEPFIVSYQEADSEVRDRLDEFYIKCLE